MRRSWMFLTVGCLMLVAGYFLSPSKSSLETFDTPLLEKSLAATKDGLVRQVLQNQAPDKGRPVQMITSCNITCGPTCTQTTCGITCLETCAATCAHTCSQATCLTSCGPVTCEVTCTQTCQETCANTCSQPTCAATCVMTCFYTCSSTQISLLTFSAVAQSDRVELQWVTASEISNYGFRLWRSLSAEGVYQVIGEVPSRSSGVVTTSYVYMDWEVFPGVTYFYKISDINVNGHEEHPS